MLIMGECQYVTEVGLKKINSNKTLKFCYSPFLDFDVSVL